MFISKNEEAGGRKILRELGGEIGEGERLRIEGLKWKETEVCFYKAAGGASGFGTERKYSNIIYAHVVRAVRKISTTDVPQCCLLMKTRVLVCSLPMHPFPGTSGGCCPSPHHA